MTPQELISLIEGLIIDNNTNQISPYKMRQVLTAMTNAITPIDGSSITATPPLIFDSFTYNLAIEIINDFVTGGADRVASAETVKTLKKLIDSVVVNLSLFPTNATSDVLGYKKLVNSMTSSDYNTTAVNIATGSIPTTNVLVASLISDPSIIDGETATTNVTLITNIRKTSGTSDAQFYYKIYNRNASGTETLLATSSTTSKVTSTLYEEFTVSAVWSNVDFLDTDRIVYKIYANKLGTGTNPNFDIQFGGSTPTRSFIPVVGVIPNLQQVTDSGNEVITSDGLNKYKFEDGGLVYYMRATTSDMFTKVSEYTQSGLQFNVFNQYGTDIKGELDAFVGLKLYDPTGNEIIITPISATKNGIEFATIEDIPISLSELTEDSTHRTVTDTEKATWNGKQPALGYTAENTANKSTDVDADKTSNIKYSTPKSIYDWATGLFSTKSMSANSFRANITNATANATEQTIVIIPETSFSPSVTWAGVLAPVGTPTASYSGLVIANQVNARISLLYSSTAGSANTSATFALPAGLPSPFIPSGMGGASAILYVGSANVGSTLTATGSGLYKALIRRNSANNGFEVVVIGTSTNALHLTCTLTYFTS